MGITAALTNATTLLAGIRADGTTPIAFPSTSYGAQWLNNESGMEAGSIHPLDRCGGSAGGVTGCRPDRTPASRLTAACEPRREHQPQDFRGKERAFLALPADLTAGGSEVSLPKRSTAPHSPRNCLVPRPRCALAGPATRRRCSQNGLVFLRRVAGPEASPCAVARPPSRT